MNMLRRAALVATYIQRFATDSPNSRTQGDDVDEPTFWAFEELADLVMEKPNEAFDVVLEILAATTDESVLNNLSAGALEDLIRHHGVRMIGDFEREAARNPRFVELLEGVWQVGPPEVWGRFKALKRS